MLDSLVWILIGAFVGWNLPQPAWARWMQQYIAERIHNFKK